MIKGDGVPVKNLLLFLNFLRVSLLVFFPVWTSPFRISLIVLVVVLSILILLFVSDVIYSCFCLVNRFNICWSCII